MAKYQSVSDLVDSYKVLEGFTDTYVKLGLALNQIKHHFPVLTDGYYNVLHKKATDTYHLVEVHHPTLSTYTEIMGSPRDGKDSIIELCEVVLCNE